MVPLVLAVTLAVVSSGPNQNSAPYADNPAAIAWIAYRAIEAGDRSRLPQLEAALSRLADDPRREAQLAVGATLDALVQLDGKPQLEVIGRTLDRYPVESLLLLKRFGAERSQLALQALKRSTMGDRWFALANLLADTPIPGFASALLQDLRLDIVVHVAESRPTGGLGVGGGIGNCAGASPPPTDFPPLASYRFIGPSQGQSLIDGIQPTFYSRSRPARVAPGSCPSYHSLPTAEERLGYVAALLGGKSLPVSAGGLSRGETWTGPAALRVAVEQYRAEVLADFTELLGLLEERGLIAVNERQSLRPTIRVRLVDERDDKSEPLPDVR